MRYYEFILESFGSVKNTWIRRGDDPQRVEKYLARFRELSAQQKLNHRYDAQKKNIDYWTNQPFDEFMTFVDSRAGTLESIDITTAAEAAAGWQISIPLNKTASCKIGSNTDWCTTKPNQPNFEEYFYDKNFILIYCINHNKDQKWAIATPAQGEPEYLPDPEYDEQDLEDEGVTEYFTQADEAISGAEWNRQTGLNSQDIIERALNNSELKPGKERTRKYSIPQMLQKMRYGHRNLEIERQIEISKNSDWALTYIINYTANGGRIDLVNKIQQEWPQAEKIIIRNPMKALMYVRRIYHYAHRMPAHYTDLDLHLSKAEESIVRDPEASYFYALDVIMGPWPPGEKVIKQHPEYAQRYAKYVLNDPDPNNWAKKDK